MIKHETRNTTDLSVRPYWESNWRQGIPLDRQRRTAAVTTAQQLTERRNITPPPSHLLWLPTTHLVPGEDSELQPCRQWQPVGCSDTERTPTDGCDGRGDGGYVTSRLTLKLGFHMYGYVMRTRHAVCGMRQQMATTWTHMSDFICASADAVCGADTESVHVAIQNAPAHESDKKFQGVTSLQTCFPNFQKWRKAFSGKVVVLCICHRGLKHAVDELLYQRITTNISSRSCRRRTSPHPAVVQEIDDSTHHIDSVCNDVVSLPTPTVPSASRRLDRSAFYEHVFII